MESTKNLISQIKKKAKLSALLFFHSCFLRTHNKSGFS